VVTLVTNGTAQASAGLINAKTADTGVTATARNDVSLTFSATGAYTINLQSDNASAQTISFSLAATGTADGLSAAVAAINDQSSKTGVIASLNSTGSTVVLTNAAGNDITVSDTTTANAGTTAVQKLDSAGANSGTAVTLAADVTANNATVAGYVTLDSAKSFSTTVAAGNTITAGSSLLKKVSDLDITTFAKATEALKTVDSAISFISGSRAGLGALQSRFETAINNVQTTSENLQASRSRILDADFAQETANLSRAQILQQAGTAMVAQANQLPQGVLALLR